MDHFVNILCQITYTNQFQRDVLECPYASLIRKYFFGFFKLMITMVIYTLLYSKLYGHFFLSRDVEPTTILDTMSNRNVFEKVICSAMARRSCTTCFFGLCLSFLFVFGPLCKTLVLVGNGNQSKIAFFFMFNFSLFFLKYYTPLLYWQFT